MWYEHVLRVYRVYWKCHLFWCRSKDGGWWGYIINYSAKNRYGVSHLQPLIDWATTCPCRDRWCWRQRHACRWRHAKTASIYAFVTMSYMQVCTSQLWMTIIHPIRIYPHKFGTKLKHPLSKLKHPFKVYYLYLAFVHLFGSMDIMDLSPHRCNRTSWGRPEAMLMLNISKGLIRDLTKHNTYVARQGSIWV